MTKYVFKRGEYIVLTKEIKESLNFKKDYIYKQREDCEWLRPEKDLKENGNNGHTSVVANKNTNWRLAYPHERKAYDKVNKPINIADSIIKEGVYVKVLKDLFGYKKGDIGVALNKADTYTETCPGYIIFVPNRKSTSAKRPNVSISIGDLEKSSVEEYNKANNPKPEVQGSVEGKIIVRTVSNGSSIPRMLVGYLFKARKPGLMLENAYYDTTSSINPTDFRLATERETIAYEAGVTNINIPKLIKGVFYKHENGSIVLWGDGDSSYYINSWGKPHKGRGRYIIDSSKFLLATEEEIAPLLKFIYEDKLKEADMKPGIDSFDDSDMPKSTGVDYKSPKWGKWGEDMEEVFSNPEDHLSVKKQTRGEKMKDLMVSLKPIKSRII